ncbi:alpha/beta hydrolase [bacterium]|nr:alpha/beta hydrolase [bacterium]
MIDEIVTCIAVLLPSGNLKCDWADDHPTKVDTSQKYLFYLHGGIVQDQGINAVSEYFGPYEYLKILDTLKSHGYNVISEARPKDTDEVAYAEKLSMQIDTLFNKGVAPKNIVLVGASLGAYITVEAAYKLKNRKINYALIGLCSEYALDYTKYRHELCGNFLSIYESSDQKGSCSGILSQQKCNRGYKEIRLTIGNGHGFLYKPYPEWVLPLVEWIEETEPD